MRLAGALPFFENVDGLTIAIAAAIKDSVSKIVSNMLTNIPWK